MIRANVFPDACSFARILLAVRSAAVRRFLFSAPLGFLDVACDKGMLPDVLDHRGIGAEPLPTVPELTKRAMQNPLVTTSRIVNLADQEEALVVANLQHLETERHRGSREADFDEARLALDEIDRGAAVGLRPSLGVVSRVGLGILLREALSIQALLVPLLLLVRGAILARIAMVPIWILSPSLAAILERPLAMGLDPLSSALAVALLARLDGLA